MAETQTPTATPAKTTRPSRARAAGSAPAKATPAKKAAAVAPVDVPAEATAVEATTKAPIKLVMNKLKDTRNYSVFECPDDSGIVGKLYLPLGTTTVKLLAE